MSTIKGTNISSPIVPYTTNDNFPTHYAKYGNGGFMSIDNLSDLNNIPQDRREPGMLVYVSEDNKLHILRNDNTWDVYISSIKDIINIANITLVSNVSSYSIVHNLGTNNVIVQVINNSDFSTYNDCTVSRFTDSSQNNVVTVDIDDPASASRISSLTVIIMGHPDAFVITPA